MMFYTTSNMVKSPVVLCDYEMGYLYSYVKTHREKTPLTDNIPDSESNL